MTLNTRLRPLLLLLAFPGTAWAQDAEQPDAAALAARIATLEKQLAEVQDSQSQAELHAMLLEARLQASESEASGTLDTNTTFSSGNRSLQALNPEMSVVMDTGAYVGMTDFDPGTMTENSQAYFRVAGFHFEANYDPFTYFKAAVGVTPNGVGLGEAYMVWTRVLPGTSLTLGKFRQQFGVINRWHAPSLDQFDRPLAMNTLLSPEGLNDVGVSLETNLPPLWAHANKITLQITNGMNDQLFTGGYVTVPVALLHLENYYDLTDATYLELGFSGMSGVNNQPGRTSGMVDVAAFDADGNPIVLYDAEGNSLGAATVAVEQPGDDEWRRTWLGGADLTVSWSPLNAQRYHNFTWRTEGFSVHKDTAAGMIDANGAYTYVDYKLSEKLQVGARYDITQPFAVENSGATLWQGVAQATWWQSPWVKTRFQLSHMDANTEGFVPVDRFTVQVVAAAGPHKHDRY